VEERPRDVGQLAQPLRIGLVVDADRAAVVCGPARVRLGRSSGRVDERRPVALGHGGGVHELVVRQVEQLPHGALRLAGQHVDARRQRLEQTGARQAVGTGAAHAAASSGSVSL
jgi:hypothetical protein